MSNSKLVDCIVYSPNHSGRRSHTLDTLTPHCVVGQLSAEGIGSCFPKGSDASCNYGIGFDGRIVLVVDECNRSWCTSSKSNDHRAITIECASDRIHPYAMKSAVYNKLVELCADICKRNGKKKVLWLGSKEKTLVYTPKSDEMVLTAHRWFADKSCPGDWLYSRYGELAISITKKISETVEKAENSSDKKAIYRVRKSWDDSKTQKGAYDIIENAKACADENPEYSVFDENGVVVYSCKKTTSSKADNSYKVKVVADKLNIRKGPGIYHAINGSIKDKGVYTIVEESSGEGASVWGKLMSDAGWISLDYVKKL